MWKDIEGYEGRYQVSDDGRVRRIKSHGRTRELKNREGLYYTVSLCKEGNKHTYAVHRLVAETFLEKPEGATEVNHKDGNKKNNDISNLEWVSQRLNRIHAMETLNKPPFGKPAKKIRCLDPETGETVQEFHSLMDAARAVGKASARTPITFVCQGLQNTAYGYKWEYIE